MTKTILLISVIVGSLLLGGTLHDDAFAAAFLKIADIKGESSDKNHEDEIDVLSWSWGMTQSGTTSTGASVDPILKLHAGSELSDMQIDALVAQMGKDKAKAYAQQYDLR